jgi:hypothetical protein
VDSDRVLPEPAHLAHPPALSPGYLQKVTFFQHFVVPERKRERKKERKEERKKERKKEKNINRRKERKRERKKLGKIDVY